jgi:outer membrane protein TolC
MFNHTDGFCRLSVGWPRARWLTLVLMLAATWPIYADNLSLDDAERMALEQAPSLKAVAASQSALQDQAVAAGELPDPMLKAGFMSLPTDTFNLGQEPMTQVQVGVVQKFPRGRSRSLRSEQMKERSAALGEKLRDERLRLLLAVREDYIEVLKQQRLAAINTVAQGAFSDLEEITQEYYATGRAQQQDVLRAAVELAKVEDRASRIAQDEESARARLESWIGPAAWRALDSGWPELGEPLSADELEQRLQSHPRIAALQEQVNVADTGVDLAEQRYKPEFGIDLTYGGRGGANADGSDRPDLFSVMLVMDLPIFHANRQDRYKAAAISESSAAMFQRDDAYRRLRSVGKADLAVWRRQGERIERFERSLLPDARDNADSALSSYQAALGDLTALMRARINEYDLKLQYAALLAERLKTRARLLYLEGESS